MDLNSDSTNTLPASGKRSFLKRLRLPWPQGLTTPSAPAGRTLGGNGTAAALAGVPPGVTRAPVVARFAAEERQFILAAARRALFDAVTSVAFSPPLVPPPSLEAKLAEQRGCFVTLTKGGLLRGCIGQVVPRDPLFQVAMENVRNAALFDPRFQPIQAEEVEAITIEISILTEPQAVAFASPEDLLDKLHPNEDGVWLKIGSRSATFLPQVWAQVPGKLEFLNLLARKAGCHASAWRDTDATVALYQVEAFAESNGSALHN